MSSPRIGILTTHLDTAMRVTDRLSTAYAGALHQAGALPLLIPTLDIPPSRYAHTLDGILIPGGDNDIHPSLYNAPTTHARSCSLKKDLLDIAWIHAAAASALPLLGICRGMQLLNCAFSGTLTQHIDGHAHKDTSAPHWHTLCSTHSRIIPSGTHTINSMHHQCIAHLAPALTATASAEDGTIEMIEHPHLPMAGVQWHPEELPDSPLSLALFSWFVQQARAYADSPSP